VDCGKEEQEDEELNGTFSDAGSVPEAPVTGTVKGNKIVFGWYVKESRTTYTAGFKGTIESATNDHHGWQLVWLFLTRDFVDDLPADLREPTKTRCA